MDTEVEAQENIQRLHGGTHNEVMADGKGGKKERAMLSRLLRDGDTLFVNIFPLYFNISNLCKA